MAEVDPVKNSRSNFCTRQICQKLKIKFLFMGVEAVLVGPKKEKFVSIRREIGWK